MKLHGLERTLAATTADARATIANEGEPSVFEQAFRSRRTNDRDAAGKPASSTAMGKKTKTSDRKSPEGATPAPEPVRVLPPVEPDTDPAPATERTQTDGAIAHVEELGAAAVGSVEARAVAGPTLSTLADLGKPGVFDQVLSPMQPADRDESHDVSTSASTAASTADSAKRAVATPQQEQPEPAPTVATRAPEHADLLMDLIAQQLPPKSAPANDSDEAGARVDGPRTTKPVVGTLAAPMQQLASDAPAPVEAAKEVKDVDWHGLAEKIVDVGGGSIEGHRARLVLGSGDERVVMTISTHANRVSVDVEQNTPAGNALAEALRNGQHELREALGRHGLDLSQQDARNPAREEATEPRERRSSNAVTKPSSEESSTPRDSQRVVVMA